MDRRKPPLIYHPSIIWEHWLACPNCTAWNYVTFSNTSVINNAVVPSQVLTGDVSKVGVEKVSDSEPSL